MKKQERMDILEKYENLPFREGRKDYLTRKYGNMWNTRFDHPWEKSEKSDYDWFKAKNILRKYLGKSFDEAFSYYCTLVPFHEQETFLWYFGRGRYTYRSYYYDYIVDDEGNIQRNPKSTKFKKSVYVFVSFDYKYGYKHKVTGEIVDPSSYGFKCGFSSYYKNTDEYEKVTLKGIYKRFDTITPEFKRLKREDIRRKRRFKKEQELKMSKEADEALRKATWRENQLKKSVNS